MFFSVRVIIPFLSFFRTMCLSPGIASHNEYLKSGRFPRKRKTLKMSYFSGKVLLGDLDDFIAPAQACSTGLFSDSNSSSTRGAQLVMEDDLDESFEWIMRVAG